MTDPTRDHTRVSTEGRAIGAQLARLADRSCAALAQQGEADDYKAWYDEAMVASNEAGFVGASAADTIRQLAAELSALKQPQAEKIVCPNCWEPGFVEPQAEAVRGRPVRVCHIKDVACAEAAVKCGECPEAAPQKAEVVPELTGCNCRWRGDEVVSRCELHESWHVAIHEWAERAKAAEAKQAEAVPPGFVLVPVEPTTEMLQALSGEWHPSRHRPDRYRAMLIAAQGAKT